MSRNRSLIEEPFFTEYQLSPFSQKVQTERREPFFRDRVARRILGTVMRRCFERYPLNVVAMVLLPEHLHALWTLPTDDDKYSLRWRWIKHEFTRDWLVSGGRELERSASRIAQRRRGIWQRRFWEHTIQDDADFDYIHYNPVKHGHVQRPCDWPWSSFHRWVRAGHYNRNWGANHGSAGTIVDAGE